MTRSIARGPLSDRTSNPILRVGRGRRCGRHTRHWRASVDTSKLNGVVIAKPRDSKESRTKVMIKDKKADLGKRLGMG